MLQLQSVFGFRRPRVGSSTMGQKTLISDLAAIFKEADNCRLSASRRTSCSDDMSSLWKVDLGNVSSHPPCVMFHFKHVISNICIFYSKCYFVCGFGFWIIFLFFWKPSRKAYHSLLHSVPHNALSHHPFACAKSLKYKVVMQPDTLDASRY